MKDAAVVSDNETSGLLSDSSILLHLVTNYYFQLMDIYIELRNNVLKMAARAEKVEMGEKKTLDLFYRADEETIVRLNSIEDLVGICAIVNAADYCIKNFDSRTTQQIFSLEDENDLRLSIKTLQGAICGLKCCAIDPALAVREWIGAG